MQSSIRLPYIDGLRGIAALLVVLQHAFEAAHNGGAGTFDFLLMNINLGRFGVVLFFLISGFVVPFSFRGDRPLLNFSISRCFRLYPAYWLSIVALVMLSALRGIPTSLEHVAANFTMVQSLLGYSNIGDVTWTLFYELVFYFLCAGLYAVGLLRSTIVIGWLTLLLFGVVTASPAQGSISDVFIVPYFFGLFFLGMVLRLAIFEQDPAATKWAIGLLPLGVAAAVVMGGGILPVFENGIVFFSPRALIMAMALPMALLLLVLWLRPRPGKAMMFLGAISYSVYLFQQLVLEIVASRIAPGEWPVLYAMVVVTATILTAAVVYRYIERPMQGLGRRMASRSVGRLPQGQSSVANAHSN